MFNFEIPFEIHLTIDHLYLDRQTEFVDFCSKNEAKALMIELAQGDFIEQPMLSKVVYSKDLDHILSISNDISNSLNMLNFKVKRLKVEIPSANFEFFANHATSFKKYFEWHAKINYINQDRLLEVCERHKAHLSLNALKNETNTRFITVREHGSKQEFELRISKLKNELQKGGWEIFKQQSEYCIYDNNEFLDKGWLPQ